MRHWLRQVVAAALEVSDRPALWLPGALAWTVTVGWAAFLVGVAHAPTVATLTFLGAGIFTSGAWPWNALLGAGGAVMVGVVGFALAAMAEAAVLRGRRESLDDARRLFVIAVVCVAPALIGILIVGLALFVVAPGEFNAPAERLGPVVRTAIRLSPILLGTLVVASAGGALHAAASRRALRGDGVLDALRGGLRALRAVGSTAVLQATALLVARIGYAALVAILLRVLWAPIADRLALAGIDAAVLLLLVGFVAIWLCLVLGGGALHAWSSTWWALEMKPSGALPAPQGRDTQQHDTPQHEGASP